MRESKHINDLIINNLFEFWMFVGIKTNKLCKTETYTAVSMTNSDWPNRIFSVSNNQENINEVLDLSSNGSLPDIITLSRPNNLENNSKAELVFRQRNMALELKEKVCLINEIKNISQVKSKEDSIAFAKTASKAFGYLVDDEVVYCLCNETLKVKMYNYTKDNECLGCGMIFFDNNNNAGLHMIGTTPEGRGQGIGKSMTEKLLNEAVINKKDNCVLHASKMGESIYRKIGFIPYGELETYRILN